MEKRLRRGLSRRFFFFLRTRSAARYPLNLWIRSESVRAGNARRSLTAGAQRPSERGGVMSSARSLFS